MILLSPISSFAALPFVTDDAGIAAPNQLVIEEFTEIWHLPKKGSNVKTDMLGQYFGLSYGVAKNLEMTVGGLVGYDTVLKKASFMNPIFQMKTMAFRSKKPEIPSIAISGAYVKKDGRGQYFDPATNYYLMGIATSRFFDDNLIVHINYGPKASYDLPTGKSYKRMHLGIALDMALIRKDIRLFTESFNGAPNSPRDSPGLFNSYQAGFRFLKSSSLSFHILYGSQPTFMGYDENNSMSHRRSNWVQFGFRKTIDDIF